MKVKLETLQALAKQPAGRMVKDEDINDATANLAVMIFVADMKRWMTPISDLPLSLRAENIMKKNNIKTVCDLRALDSRDVENLKHAGRMVRTEVYEVVKKMCNLTLVNWEERYMRSSQ